MPAPDIVWYLVLVDVIVIIRRSKDFTFVDVVDLQLLENLRFHEVADPNLGHDRNGHGLWRNQRPKRMKQQILPLGYL